MILYDKAGMGGPLNRDRKSDMRDERDDIPMDDDGLEDTVADVELDELLDSVETVAEPDDLGDEALGEYDPERGQSRIGGRNRIAGQLLSESGLFVFGAIAALVGLAVLIYALVMQTVPSLIAAAVICPPTMIWGFFKWRRWLGSAPYFYRMLMTLNEKEAAVEALEQHQERQRRRLAKKLAELERKGIRIED